MGSAVKSVLLAEASPSRRRTLTALIEQRGCRVVAPASLGACIELLRSGESRGSGLDAIVASLSEPLEQDGDDLLALLHGAVDS